MLGSILLLAALQGAQTVTLDAGARDPAWTDGGLAVSLRGDLWVFQLATDGSAVAAHQLTQGAAWDHEPTWSADGEWLVFTSDRAGNRDIWRIRADGSGAAEQMTQSTEPEGEATVGPDGTIVFVRGVGPFADLWERSPSGSERQLTIGSGADRSPVLSATGGLAWVREASGRHELRYRPAFADSASEKTLMTDRLLGRLAWSSDERLALTSLGSTAGVWVVDPRGGRPIPLIDAGTAVTWSPDARSLAVGIAEAAGVGYNGDPDRLGDRNASDVQDRAGEVRIVAAPAPLRPHLPLQGDAVTDRASFNAAAYDRVWDRLARLYFGAKGAVLSPEGNPPPGADAALAEWWRVGARHRAAALTAANDSLLDAAIQALLQNRPPARREAAGRAAVSSAHPLATAAGTEILEAGGNVVDAAVAVSFAIGVVEPDASGLGGYGEMLIHLEGMSAPTAIEFMTRVPQEATLDNPTLRNLPPDGPVLANVPGTVAGMGAAWEKYGKLPWARLLEPAIRIAESGFVLDGAFATTLRREYEAFAKYESSRALFFRDGKPLQAGDTLRNPDLARTLREIAADGARAFYAGDVGRRIAEDLHANGNPVTHEDFARYFAAERMPVTTTYRGHTIFSGPPPVTGGVGLVSKLNLLEHAAPGRSVTDDAAKLHAMIEAWKLQPSTNGRIADPDSWPVDITPFESKDTARARWACFQPDRASAPNAAGENCTATSEGPVPEQLAHVDAEACVEIVPITPECRSTGTTAFAVADAAGNMVAVTQTLGTWGGNFYVSPGLGFLYNDKMRSFRTDPDAYGARIPYARVTTVIAPTLVFRGTGNERQPLLAVGAAGNAWITSAVYETVVGVIDHGLGPQEALEQPRFLPGGRGPGGTTTMQIEDAFDPSVLRALERMGHSFRRISLRGELRMGYGAAVLVRDARAIAGADPRRSGAAGAVR